MNDREKLFEDWWNRDGKFIDPDFSDVPWFDKRKGLAAAAFDAAMDMSRNWANIPCLSQWRSYCAFASS